MKTFDISETPLVRRYGVRGAKIFVRLWFPLLYGFLIALTFGFFVGAPAFAGWRRALISFLASGLIVLAASLVTRMRLEFLAAIDRLDTREKA